MADEFHFSTIAQTAELLRARNVSPVELTQMPEAHRRARAAVERLHHRHRRPRAQAGARSRARDRQGPLPRPAARHSVRAQGHLQHQRHPDDRRLESRHRQRPGRRRDDDAEAHARPARSCSASCRRTSSRTAARRSTCRGRPRAIRGTSSISPAARPAARAPRSRRASFPRRSAPTPAARSAARRRFCGITGFMPTYGLVSRAGVMPNSFTFDHCGPMARTVEDCAIAAAGDRRLRPARRGQHRADDPRLPRGARGDIKGLRIGVLRHYWEEDLPAHEDQRRAMEEAIERLPQASARTSKTRARGR